jgi:hypothetical protein
MAEAAIAMPIVVLVLLFAVDAKVEEFPGGVVIVSVSWAYPSIMEGLCSLFSNDCPDRFYGTVTSSWKKEGW